MLKPVIVLVYLLYTATACFLCAMCHRWWCKLLVTAAGLGGLSLLLPLSVELTGLLTSLLSMALSIGVYLVLFIIFIKCMFPGRRR